MRHTTFGRTSGLRVSALALGTGTFGTRWGHGSTPEVAARVLDRFADAGGTFLDTADGYQVGESEEILGELLDGRRERFTLATKFSLGQGESHPLTAGNSRQHMVRAVENSLRRLRTDRVDLLWVHAPDGLTPMEEVLRGLDDLARAGKVLHAGLSNFPAWRTARGVALAEARGQLPLAAVQFEYSLVERTADREVLPMAEALGLGAALWSPLGGGLLTGKYRSSGEGRLSAWGRVIHTEDDQRKTAAVDVVLAVADELGAAPAQVAVAWLLAKAERSTTALVPIIGPRTEDHLESYLGALDVHLSAEQLATLDKASAVPLGQPHDFFTAESATLHGGGDFRAPVIPVA
ncbi:aldo/keto reductase [Actinokineospora bangkokensis]|uniref:Oxidoreductase n=1 Tax=Actinokineospora bangkokensis TaxID=1193682 RepID=A0A1Q9LLW1_9PSEU|nr:aldo/keto reductase [Actinokineospora bangkokensis]OLR93010.1 oxidoreductase [Actinokineospora bangkokensis]